MRLVAFFFFGVLLSTSSYCQEDDGETTTTTTEEPEMTETTTNLLTTIMSIVTTMSPMNVSEGMIENVTLSSPLNTTELSTTSTSTTTAKPQPMTPCDMQLQKSDHCTKEALFIGQYTAEIPKDLDDMETMCEEKKESVNCIKEYGSKCLKNVPRQVFMGIIKNIRKLFKTYCSTPAGRQAFLSHMACIKPEHLTILNDVLGKLTLSLQYAADDVPRSSIITYACCSLHRTYEEIPDAMANVCAPNKTPLETIAFFKSLVRRTVGDILDVGCGRYASLEYCDANFKEGMNNIRGHLGRGLPLPESSFIVPLIKFTTKLDGN